MLTSNEILKEYAKCLMDPKYAIETYLQTFDKTQEGFVPFKLFERQKYIVDSYEQHRWNIVTKPRQAGISTTTQAYASIKCAFADSSNPETVIVIANKLNLAKKFLKGIKDYASQLPRWVWGPEYYGNEEREKKSIFIKDSQIEIEMPNGSKVIAVATSTDALRGYTPTLLIFDEAAFIDRGAELYSAAVTSLGCLTKDSLILTENGLIELDELIKEKDVLGFTDLDKPHMVCNRYGNLTPATQTFVSEYGETYRIKTKLGIELEGSWKHPILVKRGFDEIWVRMNKLSVGDKPIINYNQNYFGKNEYIINDYDYDYPSNELLKAKKEILNEYIENLFFDRDYFISKHNKTLRRVQSILFNMGIISIIDGDMLVKLKFNHDFDGVILDEIESIEISENYTYDLHVPETNSFISNSMISHNTGGGCILVSTPNGYDELYYKTYEQAEKGENEYNIIELKWYQDPRYNKDLQWIKGDELFDEFEFTLDSFEEKIKQGYKPTSTWYRDMCKGMNNDKKRIAQELDVSFLGSGGNVIDDEYIMMHEKENLEKPKFVDDTYYDGTSGLIWIWNEPIEGHQYILSADVSRGDGLDFSTFQIIDFTTMEQVVEFQGKIPPDVLAEAVNNYGLKYNAYVVIDNIGVGHTTASKLQEYKYPNLHYESVKTEKGKLVPGFNVNGVRIQLISHLESMIRTNAIKIKSRRLLNEFKTFIFKNGRPDHMAGYNDDLIMALGMGLWVMETSFKKLKKLESQTKALLSAWQVGSSNQKTDDIYNTGFVPKQQRNKKTTGKPNFNPIVAKNMQDPKGEYLWLFSGLK